jgi:Protein of unknown function (DUF3800)
MFSVIFEVARNICHGIIFLRQNLYNFNLSRYIYIMFHLCRRKVMYNIYCDESCHLENDCNDIMVLGAMSCPTKLKEIIFDDIRKIKVKHGLSSWFEIKWTKVSYSKIEFYLELVDYFFKTNPLKFRGIVATGKKNLNHEEFGNTYDSWYYIMYYLLLNPIIHSEENYRIFIDIKDTQGGKKIKKLHEVLSNSKYDFNKQIIKDIKQINSRESEILQLCDLFIGAISYYNRGLYFTGRNEGKKEIIKVIMNYSGKTLSQKTSVYESKFNLFIWEPQGSR